MREKLNIHLFHDNAVECGACQRGCVIPHEPGRLGFCGAYGVDESGKFRLLTYGHTPIRYRETLARMPVVGFRLPETEVLSLGNAACNFRCQNYCFNWRWANRTAKDINQEELARDYWGPKETVALAKRLGVEGIAFGYTEPATQFEWVYDVSQLAKEKELFTVLQTNGSFTIKALDYLVPLIDVYRVGIRGPQKAYDRLASGISLREILEATAFAKTKGTHIEMVASVIPGLSDSEEWIGELSLYVKEKLGSQTPLHFERFYQPPAVKSNFARATPRRDLEKAVTTAKKQGLENVFIFDIGR